jgi:hypothetical protein
MHQIQKGSDYYTITPTVNVAVVMNTDMVRDLCRAKVETQT